MIKSNSRNYFKKYKKAIKNFKKEFSRFVKREKDFLENRNFRNFIPQLLDYASNYLIKNYFENAIPLNKKNKLSINISKMLVSSYILCIKKIIP